MSPAKRQRAAVLVTADGVNVWTTSDVVAREFGRRHDNVLQSIRNLIDDGTIRHLDFKEADYLDEQGKPRLSYSLNERAFLTAMPFIGGKKARLGQVRLVDAFLAQRKAQAKQYRAETRAAALEWQHMRAAGKIVRRSLTDTLKEFDGYRKAQGSTGPANYYASLSKTICRAMTGSKADGREGLTARHLADIAMAEQVAQRAIDDGMAARMPHKDIYARAKSSVSALGRVLGGSLRLAT